ncbi:hypothetical protein ACIRL2_49190 [Embleya sp. NPDC127516]|uniref:hypothetical protein n=1 Tax=Embleya sp. NPDC127516 TaxID=3363990 RepID=UPI00380D378E
MREEGVFGRDEATPLGKEGGALSSEDVARTSDARQPRATEGWDDVGADPTGPGETGDQSGERSDTATAEHDASHPGTGSAPLLGPQEAEGLRSRWQDIQQGFVDDPRNSVDAADRLVDEVMRLLAATFAGHKKGLEAQWHRGEEPDTEDLRIALRQYRSFFDRLLNT